MRDSYCRVKDGELFIFNLFIGQHKTTGKYFNHEEKRSVGRAYLSYVCSMFHIPLAQILQTNLADKTDKLRSTLIIC